MILTKNKIKKFDVDFEIDQRIKSDRLSQLLIIVPTNRKIRDLKKEIITLSPKNATGKINLETLSTLFTKLLFNDSEIKGTILSDAAATVLLKQSFQQIKAKYFSNYKDEIPSGTLERIKNVISEYKKNGIAATDLRRESESLSGSEKLKAEDIADIYEKYQANCDKLGVKEIGDVYNQLNRLDKMEFEKRFRNFFPEVNAIVIQGFDEFTMPEIEIINSTSEVPGSELFLSFDYSSSNSQLFKHLDRCYGKLKAKGFNTIEDSSKSLHNKFQSAIRNDLFNGRKSDKIKDFKKNITKITAQGRAKEIELIAKEIKDLITGKGTAPNKICVAFNLIQKYSPLIRDVFSVYNIPINLTDRYALNASPPVIAIINLLEVLENDFYYKNILRALSGGFLDKAGINQSNLLRVSVELKIISGYNNWKSSIEDSLAQISDDDDEEFANFSFDKEEYQKALNDIELIHELVSPFDKKMRFEEFLEKFTNLIYRLNIPLKLVESGGKVEENVKALTTTIETVTELLELFKLEYNESDKFPLRFYLNNIRTAVNSSRYNIKERQGYGVQITTLNEIRGLKFDHLFIAGLCDGDLPTRYTPEIFFSPSFIKNEQKHQAEERYRFYQALCIWEKSLYFTNSSHDVKKELVESNFLTEFLNIFEVADKSEKDFESTVYSKEELLEITGRVGTKKIKKEVSFKELKINPEEIEKALRIDGIRLTEPFGDSEFTGRIFNDLSGDGKSYLENFREKQFSISQLETYAKCPYKYFAERVLKLKPIEEPTEEIEALEMGTLLHNILFEFYTKINEKGIRLQNCSNTEFKSAGSLIFKIAEDKIEKANFHSPVSFFEKEKVLGINGNKQNSILYKFLEAERNSPDGFTPAYFEEGFGNISTDGEGKKVSNLTVENINIRGKIDRIDVDEEKEHFKVIDYKLSGKAPSATDLISGISLQLPLYMFAAKHLIKAQLNKDFLPAEADIYSLKFSDDKFGPGKISNIDSRKRNIGEEEYINANNELIKICIESIKKYVNSIVEGKFNLTTLNDRDNKICNYCNFKSICRIQEVN